MTLQRPMFPPRADSCPSPTPVGRSQMHFSPNGEMSPPAAPINSANSRNSHLRTLVLDEIDRLCLVLDRIDRDPNFAPSVADITCSA